MSEGFQPAFAEDRLRAWAQPSSVADPLMGPIRADVRALLDKLGELDDRNRWRWPAERERADRLEAALCEIRDTARFGSTNIDRKIYELAYGALAK